MHLPEVAIMILGTIVESQLERAQLLPCAILGGRAYSLPEDEVAILGHLAASWRGAAISQLWWVRGNGGKW